MPKKVLYPGNSWRDYKDYETAVMNVQEESFMGLDGATIIPVQYDLMRTACLSEAIPGKPFYSVDEYYKRTYELITDEDGYIKKLSLVVEQGEFCSISDKEGKIYVCDGQIQIYNKKGIRVGQIQVQFSFQNFNLFNIKGILKYLLKNTFISFNIAHRLSTNRGADTIMVIDNGGVIDGREKYKLWLFT